MKFIMGSWHAKDVPFHLETEALVCKRLTMLEYVEPAGTESYLPEDLRKVRTPTKSETYVLRWWRFADQTKVWFMALEGPSQVEIEGWARRVLNEARQAERRAPAQRQARQWPYVGTAEASSTIASDDAPAGTRRRKREER
jgi:hypothetical protein